MKKKVIFFISSGCGGAERQAIIISRCLSDDEFDVSYFIFGPINQLEKFFPQHRKVVFRKEPKFTHNLLSNMRKVIKKEKPDVVYGAGMPINWRLVIAASFCKCKIVLRNENYIYTQSWIQKLRLAITYRFADYVIAQTEEMADGLVCGLLLSRNLVHTVPNAIDKSYISKCLMEQSPYANSDKVRFVAVGRFHLVKGFDLLVRAFKTVKANIPNAELYIIGAYQEDNALYREVQKYLSDESMSDCVFCVGFKNNPYVYMKHADCFVLSSRNEGLPNVMIEALYLGTPVAAYKCIPVIERIVDEGKTGYLAVKENVTELSDAMQKACRLGRIKTSYSVDSEEVFRKIFTTMSSNSVEGMKITNRKQLKIWIEADFLSYKMEHPLAARFTYGENWELYSYMRNLRHLEYYNNKSSKMPWDKLLSFYYWMKHRRNIKKMDISIAPNSVGPGFHLQHRGFRHILPETKIGENCEILPMVLIGKKTKGLKNVQISIGDNCYISTGVIILGNVSIGNNVTIAAGAVVMKDVPDDCVVGGVPAKIIKYKK